MKIFLPFCFMITICLTSCGKSDDSQSISDMLQQEWHYISFFGAEAPQCQYDRGDKIFTFGVSTLLVVDNYLDDDWCGDTFKGEGTYNYEVKVVGDMNFLFIEDVEQGRIRFVEGDLLIESWVRSDGVIIDDAPSYQLEL